MSVTCRSSPSCAPRTTIRSRRRPGPAARGFRPTRSPISSSPASSTTSWCCRPRSRSPARPTPRSSSATSRSRSRTASSYEDRTGAKPYAMFFKPGAKGSGAVQLYPAKTGTLFCDRTSTDVIAEGKWEEKYGRRHESRRAVVPGQRRPARHRRLERRARVGARSPSSSRPRARPACARASCTKPAPRSTTSSTASTRPRPTRCARRSVGKSRVVVVVAAPAWRWLD